MSLGQAFSRFALVHDDDGAPRWFVWTMHHALYDGWSIQLIMNTLQQTYRFLDEVPGPTMATVPFRLRLGKNMMVREYLQSV